ncbi:MAG: M28 family peptidase [Anaerosomatales bacterium]|nr:M28 family peptidase [Anaerosomatales bacterium]MDT8433755.1 M28 family peptidase [Anaerosomatales bacterium]
MSQATEHLHQLATVIGPRPATTDAEAEAADYIESVFRQRGADVERQEFDSPRTYGWAFAVYHVLTIGAAVASGWTSLRWPAFAVTALVAFLFWMDIDTRFGLSGWLPPKGPSQNIIARHVPKARRGERPTRVVVVAHYDTAKASYAFSPSMVKNFSTTFAVMKWCTLLVPVFVLAGALPFTAAWDPWLWYATIAASAYLAVPLGINVHREIFMPAVDGANDNASGVAVMLGVMERIIPEPDDAGTRSFRPVRQGPEAARAADVVPEGAELRYMPAGPPEEEDVTALPDDFEWAEERPLPSTRQEHLDFETIEFDAIGEQEAPAPAPRPVEESFAEEVPAEEPRPERTGLLGRFGKKRRDEAAGVGGWLGVDDGFDVRDAGRKIGSWEKFGDDEDEKDFGFKGGRAGEDPLGDPDFAAAEASRIRRRVSETVDRALSDKEVWFVATGAEEAGTWGMRAFLDAYGPDLKGALIINLDNLGTGVLHMVTEEGMARRYRSDRRLVSAGKRASRENDMPVRARPYTGLSTDATPALARGYRAMSVMAFDANGRLPNWHWHTDVEENVDPGNLELAERFVTETVRSL